ncbi:MAG: adenylate/guanylate cyclase domain-containing protein, partial [Betaproteobacteria bacterium]
MKQTVSFLFTDIEGSSRLWEQLGDRMGELLAAHDALARLLVAEYGGVIVKFTGDGLHAAFTDPLPALQCGVQLLLRMRTLAVDGGDVKLKLRAGLHMGPCEARDGDFFGESVNRAARIANAAHGDQFIISDAVAASLNDAMVAPLSLRTLGRIRLRDLSGEETLHQVLHQDLQSDFPPLRSLSQVPNNLPSQRTSFVGRHGELRSLAAHLDEHRLVTLVGTGGIGKTRLALQTCARVLDKFEEGVWSVELAGTSDPARVADTLLAGWNLAVAPGSTSEDTLCEYLAPRRALLLLDNCEHLIDACARLIDQILRRAPNIKIVATSREPLDVDGELVYRIPGLPLPDPDFEGGVDALCEVEAVRLFVERAQLQLPTWQVVPEEASMLAVLCYRLDGIPLAIELAAARMRDLGLADILRGLENRFGFLITGSRVAAPRHKTLAGLVDWSYQLLPPHEQRLFQRLAVFHGGIPIEIAIRACADAQLTSVAIETGLAALADKSLLFRLETNG